MSVRHAKFLRDMRVRIQAAAVLLLSAALAPSAGRAQNCTDPGAYCEGWARDSSRREVTLTRSAICHPSLGVDCSATCSTAPISALPSIRVGSLDHVVLGFTASNACDPECAGSEPVPCYNLGVSYRRVVDSGSEDVVGAYNCDVLDPTFVSAGATFSATYHSGGTDDITVSNIVYGSGLEPCGEPPTQLDLVATGPTLAIQSHFTFSWLVDLANVGNSRVTGYTETRTYTSLPSPNNVVHITVTNIDYGAGTFTASAPDAGTPARRGSWGALKVRYR